MVYCTLYATMQHPVITLNTSGSDSITSRSLSAWRLSGALSLAVAAFATLASLAAFMMSCLAAFFVGALVPLTIGESADGRDGLGSKSPGGFCSCLR